VAASAAWLAVLMFDCQVAFAQQPARLGQYKIDSNRVSISGVSSGAFMANQFHVAHSELIMGAGLVAGGLYGCAVSGVDKGGVDAQINLATGACTTLPSALRSPQDYRRQTEQLASFESIDPLAGLEGDRVYLFTGEEDTVVNSVTVERAMALYGLLGVNAEDLLFCKWNPCQSRMGCY